MLAAVARRSTRRHARVLRRAHSTQTPGDGPLSGIRVLDLTRVLAGPYCTMLLGDLGASVIKVEHPLRGDDTRAWGPPFAPYTRPAPTPSSSSSSSSLYSPPPEFPGESAYYLCVNRNKQSVAVDMKREEGRKVLVELAKRADVLVENYVPGKLAEYGLGYDDLRRVNPRLVYASITGYGSTGPYSGRPGYDVIIEAEAGLMHITGEASGAPVKVGVAVTDILTGVHTQGAIMAALIARARTGQGQHIDASLLQTQVAMLANIGANYLVGGMEARRWGTRHPSIAPYQVFPTRDGSVCLGAGNDRQFAQLACKVLQRPELTTDRRFLTNKDRVANRLELVDIINEKLSSMSTDQVLSLLDGCGLPYGPVNNIEQTFEHPQVVARGMVRVVEHPWAGPVKMVGPAVEYSGFEAGAGMHPPPMLGEHTELVLRDVLGYDDKQIEQAVRGEGIKLYRYK
ncbi:hypothetical protein LPJ53_000488 [Coemansia erecta]|uniref:CoA-transferase family III n=1 Tax=Coemansia erecta TaxID=147472 RepID=A0A9W7Y1W8_9FUNG|nr:hypothetical protein LPJ53_000488 [Coemansia erecta]